MLFLAFSATISSDISLWDHVVKMEQVILSVEYNGRHLNVWMDANHGYNRFYVTPLCVIDIESINCKRNEYSNVRNHVYSFYLKLWDSSAAQMVEIALKQKNVTVKASDILPLPMQMVRLGVGNQITSKIQVEKHWRSHQDQPNVIIFELFTKHKHFCDKMVNDSKADLETFLARTKLYFEFSMVLQQRATRNLNISGSTIAKSSFFRMVYLTSKDLNNLVRDIINVISVEEEVTSTYIPSEEENQIIKELLGIIGEHRIHSRDLTKDEWNSVFWNDIFSRPDVQTEYFNDTVKYDENENRFSYNATRDHHFREKIKNKYDKQTSKTKSGSLGFTFDGFGFNTSGSKLKSINTSEDHLNDKERQLKDSLSFEDFKKAMAKRNVNTKWTGTKFEPKPFNLHRINLRQLSSSSEVYFKRIITTNIPSTQKIEIRPENLHHAGSAKNIGLLLNEDIINKLNGAIKSFDAKTDELKNQFNLLQSGYNDLNQYSRGNLDKYVPVINENLNKIGAVQNQVNQVQNQVNNIQQSHNDLNGFSRGQIQNILNAVNTLNEFQNKWAGQLDHMVARLEILKQQDFAIMQCTDELSDHSQPVQCLRNLGYKD
uniref:Uncharacterized protein n=1 Tax=Panagrolaimus sp. ES5 TaxID=591445 RepID=A0AC34FAE8_9BILA